MTPKCTMARHGVTNRMHAVVTAAAFPNSLFALFFRSIAQQRKKIVTIRKTWQHQSAVREMQAERDKLASDLEGLMEEWEGIEAKLES